MSISLTRYVDITSGAGAGTIFPTRDLVGRLFTDNILLPPQSFLQFTSSAQVQDYFGIYTEEYYRALFYFSFISKSIDQPEYIQFARFVNDAVAPMIFSAQQVSSLSAWISITSGSFGLTIGTEPHEFTSLNFSSATSLANIASIIQAAINAIAEPMWEDATVVYENNGFTFTGGVVGGSSLTPITVQYGQTGTDITAIGLLGWLPNSENINGNLVPQVGSIWTAGSGVEVITDTLTKSDSNSNNFGSFLFLNNINISLSQITQSALWNQSENVKYLYTIPVLSSNVTAYTNALSEISGCALTVQSPSFTMTATLNGTTLVTGLQTTVSLMIGMLVTDTLGNIEGDTFITEINSSTSITISKAAVTSITEVLTFYPIEFPEMIPMVIEAATDYYTNNSVQNYMYQTVSGITPSVSDDSTADAYDSLAVNYYGTTQSAGIQLSFYQRGLMQGQTVSSAISDMTAYVNEIWLKDALSTQIINFLVSQKQIPANQLGRAQLLSIIQIVILQALANGTISVGKALTASQISYITSASGNPNAFYNVMNEGYWLDCIIQQIPDVSPAQYEAVYTLIYSKDDVIRFVQGTDTLI